MSFDLEEIVSLRLRTESLELRDPAAARSFITGVYQPLVDSARRIEVLDSGRRGLVLLNEPAPQRFGVPEASALVLLEPGCEEAKEWGARALGRAATDFDQHFKVQLDAADRTLVKVLEPLGFGVAKIDLMGEVELALERLEGGAVDQVELGFEFAPASVEQAPAINILIRDFFLQNPHLGWGGLVPPPEEQAAIDAVEEAKLIQRFSKNQETDFVVTKDGRLLGYFGFDAKISHPLLGNFGGFNIVLLPEIQGLGLGKAAYLRMLRRMKGLQIDTLFGRTSSPGVIRIASKMGRRLRRLVLRKDPPFIPSQLIP